MKKEKAILTATRTLVQFNTGTRTMATPKNPSRAKSKRDWKKSVDKHVAW